jgi:hypothetical protein
MKKKYKVIKANGISKAKRKREKEKGKGDDSRMHRKKEPVI